MAKKRKKYPKLPNNFGSIRYLGKNRRNCFAVHPPATPDDTGKLKRPPAICYVDDWIKGFTVLTAYKAGTYRPGMERTLEVSPTTDMRGSSQRGQNCHTVQKKHTGQLIQTVLFCTIAYSKI